MSHKAVYFFVFYGFSVYLTKIVLFPDLLGIKMKNLHNIPEIGNFAAENR